MNKLINVLFSFIFISSIFLSSASAASYSVTDVSSHNSTSNCWVIYDGKVYDITTYLNTHDTKYYFIDSWCGTDMTVAYNTMDGQGQSHKTSTTTNILSQYYIGDISATVVATSTPTITPEVTSSLYTTYTTITPTVTPVTNNNSTITLKNPYDFWPAFLITTILLWGSYALSKTGFWKTKFSPLTYNMFWNSILIISLIPSTLFGLFMILQYSVPSLASIDFNFLYWHVEGSICFAVIVIAHIILRLKTYFAQVRTSFKKKVSAI